jgi:predicted transcriptional regulator
MSDTRKFFLNEKPVLALLAIQNAENETYCSRISEKIDSTYAHTVKIVSRMKELGLLETREEGRKKMVSLSEEGEKQAEIFQRLMLRYEPDADPTEKLNSTDPFSK